MKNKLFTQLNFIKMNIEIQCDECKTVFSVQNVEPFFVECIKCDDLIQVGSFDCDENDDEDEDDDDDGDYDRPFGLLFI
jgi:hypothetical protein